MNRRFGSWMQALSAAVVLGLLGVAATCLADPNEDVGTAAFPTLKLGVGAATVGRGGAGIALSEDAYATYWNPAGLAHTRATHLALMNNEWILDLRQNYAAFAHPLNDTTGLGVFVNYFDYGEIEGRDETGEPTGVFRPSDLAAGVGVGFAVNDDLSIGVQGKILRQEIDDASASGFAVDAGIRYDIPDTPASVAATIQHLGTSMKFDTEGFSLPTTLRAGVGYRIADDTAALALDIAMPTDDDIKVGAGISYEILDPLVLRGGYRYDFGGADHGTVAGLTGGFGLLLGGFVIDYAFVSLGDLGPSNRVSLSTAF
ncbi:PorV/PorQ family protein [Candidatus Poribacteria bacterium]|nr:PorV/PorQ family protein [Candidatus Poribacteria bacterium]MBT5534999.1 PorV/PorQ family protein [Candidatus Poribacteria bacterium]MBT5711093.1 PorV/PorQ family protein [Candidatus Poribacteria bacterium]MBT7101780.1 PorV/PorQ family protein [Candidatus Poribacteria bacterium]MBT7803883.1 PorV/PorQ family protein [Candidatus Poribacteria bacterium]